MVESAELGLQPSEIPAEKQLWMQGRGHVSHHPPREWEWLMVVFVNLTRCAHWSGWVQIDFLGIRFWSFGPQSVWSGWMWWMTSPWVIWQMNPLQATVNTNLLHVFLMCGCDLHDWTGPQTFGGAGEGVIYLTGQDAPAHSIISHLCGTL